MPWKFPISWPLTDFIFALGCFCRFPFCALQTVYTGRKLFLGLYPNCYILGEDVGRNDSWLISQLHFPSSVSLNTAGVFLQISTWKSKSCPGHAWHESISSVLFQPWDHSYEAVGPMHSDCRKVLQQVRRILTTHLTLSVAQGPCHENWVHFDHRASEKKTIITPSANEQSFHKSLSAFQNLHNQRGSSTFLLSLQIMLILLSRTPKSSQGPIGTRSGGHSAEFAPCQLGEALREALPGGCALLDLWPNDSATRKLF